MSLLGSVSDSNDGVTSGGTALTGVDDSLSITVEWSLGGDRDGSWSLSNGSLEGRDGVWLDSVGADRFDLTVGFAVFAGSSLGGVLVVALVFLVVTVQVFETSMGGTTVTSVGLGVAINKLLLGEVQELSTLDFMTTFHRGSGRESPAGSAMTLVLYMVHGTLLSPVDGRFKVVFWELGVGGEIRWLGEITINLVLLSLSPG